MLHKRQETLKEVMDAARRIQWCEGDPDGVREILDGLSVEAMEMLVEKAFLASQDGQYRQAVDTFELLTAKEPFNPIFWMGLGMAKQAGQEYEEAITAFNMADGLTFGDPYPSYYAAECYFSLSRATEGLKALDEAEETCKVSSLNTDVLQPYIAALREAWAPKRQKLARSN